MSDEKSDCDSDPVSVKFVGGPMDGLVLVDGISQMIAEPRLRYAILGHAYQPRDRFEDEILVLDYTGKISIGQAGR